MTNQMNKIKIGIVEDSEIHGEWLMTVLGSNSDFEIVSLDQTAKAGIQSARQFLPDVVVLDFQLEDMTGLEAVKWISTFNEQIKIFIITAHSEILILERLIQQKNIQGLAVKGSRYFEDNLVVAIKNIAAGGVYLEPSLLNKLRESGKSNGISELTRREFEVFIQSSAGKPDNKIAEDLCVELSHIKNIKSKIAKKLKNIYTDSLLYKLVENAHPNHLPEEIIG